MKTSHAIQRMAGLSGAVRLRQNQVVIRFQNSRLLRFFVRAAFLVAVIVYFPWYRAGYAAAVKTWEACFSPEFIRDLNGVGLLTPDADGAVFLGDHSSQIAHVVENLAEPVHFVFVANDDSSFQFADGALKISGGAAAQIDPLLDKPFRIPSDFRIAYTRRFSSAMIAGRKVAKSPTGILLADTRTKRRKSRRLLAVPESKLEALKELEDVALEPPVKGRLQLHRLTRYLPDLLGDSLADYCRRVFVDVGPADRPGSELWFARQYPTRNLDFEIIRVDVDDVAGTADSPENAAGVAGSMTEWLRRNAREEDFVVMKAEAEVVEEIVKEGAIALVDELFLECRNQWQREKGAVLSRRAYWECLALYGELRDEGVAVHQWWWD